MSIVNDRYFVLCLKVGSVFGNPKGGTPFMVASPEAAIDFPLKALVWENAAGKVHLSYNTVSSILFATDLGFTFGLF